MIYLAILLGAFFMEMAIKVCVEKGLPFGKEKDVLKGWVTLRKLHNKGAVLGFLKSKPEFLKASGSLLILALVLGAKTLVGRKGKPLTKTGYALLLAGAAGNLYDRFKRGYVVDYFSVKAKPIQDVVFNLSDVFLLVGSLLVLLFGRRAKRPVGERRFD